MVSRGNIFDYLAVPINTSLDFNIIYVTLIINLIEKMLRVWIKDFQSQIIEAREEYCETMFETYVNIFEAYQTLQKAFGAYVSFTSHFIWKIFKVLS